nr:YolD-like family protein [Sporosarcina ureilytica]
MEWALKSKSTIKLTYWCDGQLIEDYGVPIEINITNKAIIIDDPFGTSMYSYDEIVGASIVEVK